MCQRGWFIKIPNSELHELKLSKSLLHNIPGRQLPLSLYWKIPNAKQALVSLGGERTHRSMPSLLKKATEQGSAQSTGSSLRVLSAVRSLPVEPNKGPPWHRGSTPPGAQSPLTHYRQKYQQCLPHCKLKIPQQSKDFSTFLQRSTWFNSLKQHRQMLSSLRSGFQTISPNCNMRRQLCLLNDAR